MARSVWRAFGLSADEARRRIWIVNRGGVLHSDRDGRALIATGSPFEPVDFDRRKIPIAQCNNVYIFPAVGLGLIASGARRVTDKMMIAAARALGENSPALREPAAALLPSLKELPRVAREIAFVVGAEAQRAGVADPSSEEELRARIKATQWTPSYPVLEKA